ncbi:hypothetical protein BBB56_22085 [Candidatus Pantoea deserta]|uniref:Uncharacterized protein n=1 Tax=Candidatus Pantoea deserta TaxID=1869313 RepID=A0A3N4NDN5_9GAMM|nr:hypothetical protein [Pantoea deserta]RPD93465.1 hypothetical protein BBB56_22085 [Pantoea deserta]
MSNELNDTVKEAAQSAKEAVINRFSGAFTAYLVTSWLAFNWSNIALLFMSKATIEQRIQAIYGQENLYIQYLISPIIAGFLLSIAIPAVNAFVVTITSKFSALSEVGQEKARAELSTQISSQRAKKLAIDKKIEFLNEEKASLEIQVDSLKTELKKLKSKIQPSEQAIWGVALKANKLLNQLRDIRFLSESDATVTAEHIAELFSEEDLSDAERWYNQMTDTFGTNISKAMVDKPADLYLSPELIKEALEYAAKRKTPSAPPLA